MKKLKLFCVPHAGASASIYYKWLHYLDSSMIELIPLELKGRGTRLDESYYVDFEDMLNDLYKMVINSLSDEKYMVFGHSMGTYDAFQLESMIENNNGISAEHMFLSDITALMRLCDVYDIPLATNMGSAEILILSLERGDLEWRNIIHEEKEKELNLLIESIKSHFYG
ncbi:hypothetical protein J2Z83_003809 [Virgibacillus natechei]|uniref:Thioesterase domain-containing protein n=1 Tax=Virgibacillus natechei TaxID=1216297 RepID=A0ABS4IL16_9BACI|nr:thioesterase domain-containing protein [Virgibacillus natechei]MBP1971657.1 hypothetical protein [Virgibacillus natechei]